MIFLLIKKIWNKNKLNFIMFILNIIGLIFIIMCIFKFGLEIII